MGAERNIGIVSAENAVPYEEIDSEIRYLVKLINSFEGIRTVFSCAGHKETEETYVSFIAESHADLQRFVNAFPFLGWRSAIVANRFSWTAIYINVALDADANLRFDLRLAGEPRHAQRVMLEDVERALSGALVTPELSHPSCPNCASGRSADTERYSR